MNASSRNWILRAALILGSFALPTLAVAAETQPFPTQYTVTSIAESATGKSIMQEGLSVLKTANGPRLMLATADGSTLTRPVTLTPQGDIAIDSQDAAVTCYNMAVDALARTQHPQADVANAFVRFGGSVVRVPLLVRSTHVSGAVHRYTLAGTSSGVFSTADTAVDAGVRINATIDEADGVLHGAAFDEVHYLETPDHVVAHSTCILSRNAITPTTRT